MYKLVAILTVRVYVAGKSVIADSSPGLIALQEFVKVCTVSNVHASMFK